MIEISHTAGYVSPIMEPVKEVNANQIEPVDGQRANEEINQENGNHDAKRRVYALHQVLEDQQRGRQRAVDASDGKRLLEKHQKVEPESSRGTESSHIRS